MIPAGQTTAQALAYLAIVLFTWGGLAVLFGVAIGRTIAERDRREQPVPDVTAAPPGAVELGTRLDVRL